MSAGATAASAAAVANALAGTSSMKQQITTNLNSSPAMQLKQKLLNNQAAATTAASTSTAAITTSTTSAYAGKIGGGGGGVSGVGGSGVGGGVMDSMLKNLFAIDARSGHLTLSRHLDYETSQRHTLIVTAMDAGQPRLSSNLTIVVEVQDVNDNPPVFASNEYHVKVLESMPVNSQVRHNKRTRN